MFCCKLIFVVVFWVLFVRKFQEMKNRSIFFSLLVYLQGILGYFNEKSVFKCILKKLGQLVAISILTKFTNFLA